MTISPHQPMIRGVRLLNAFQRGLPPAEFGAALENPTLAAVVDTLLRRRGASWAHGAIDAAVGSLSAAQAAAYLTSGHILSPYVVASSAAMSLVAGSSSAMTAVVGSATALAAISATPAAMFAMLNSATALAKILATPAAKSAIFASTALAVANVPAMTSNTAPSGAASSISEHSAQYATWKAFDGNAETFWNSAEGTTNLWLQYSFAKDAFINKVVIQPYETSGPRDVSIQYSDDGVIFTTAKSLTIADVPLTAIDISAAGFHKHWRLFMHNIYSATWVAVNELNFTGFVKP